MKRKAIIRIAGFLLIFVILLEIFCVIFDGGYWFEKKFIYDRNARMAAFELEQKGQINVLNIGDSLSTTSLAPMELYRDYGYTSYNLGQDLQTPIESYYALKTQPIKVVLYEAHTLFYNPDPNEFPTSLLAEPLKTDFPFLRFHYVWLKYWKKRSIREYFHGFLQNSYIVFVYPVALSAVPVVVFASCVTVMAVIYQKTLEVVSYAAGLPVFEPDIMKAQERESRLEAF